MTVPPPLTREKDDYLYDRTAILQVMLKERDGYKTIFALTQAGWTHNEVLKENLKFYRWAGETVVTVKEEEGRPQSIITLTEMVNGFPSARSLVRIRDMQRGLAEEMPLEDYLKCKTTTPTRPFHFVYDINAYRKDKPDHE